jgi:hypothetical protein
MPPTDPHDITPEKTFRPVLGAWTLDLRDEVNFYRENPQGKWNYSEDQYRRKLWMEPWRDRELPPHLKDLFNLSYTTDKLLERWKEGRGNEAQSRTGQKRLWGMIDQNISKIPLEISKLAERARSQRPEGAPLSTSEEQKDAFAQTIQRQSAAQMDIQSPLLREEIAAREQIMRELSIGDAPPPPVDRAINASSASGITTAGGPIPSQRDDSTAGTASALPGLRGAFTTGSRRRTRLPSQRDDSTAGTASALPGLRGAFTTGSRHRTRPESVQQEASGAQLESRGGGGLDRDRVAAERAAAEERAARRRESAERGQEDNGLG